MKRLYFIRHGLSVDNVNGVYSGRVDTELTDEGRQQVKDAAKEISKLEIDFMISSPYKRTLESAQIIARQINYPVSKIEVNNLFAERKLGELEGQPYKPASLTNDVKGIEKTSDLIDRAKLAFSRIQDLDAENILVVSHGSFGRALRATVSPDKYTYRDSEPFHNGELTIFI